jgi:hypothetical protein
MKNPNIPNTANNDNFVNKPNDVALATSNKPNNGSQKEVQQNTPERPNPFLVLTI